MRQPIGGTLNLAALEALSGNRDADRMRHFTLLSADQQSAAIRRLHLAGHSDHGIAGATRLSVEQIRRVLAEHQP